MSLTCITSFELPEDRIVHTREIDEDRLLNAPLDAEIDAANRADMNRRMSEKYGERWLKCRTDCFDDEVAEHKALLAGAA